MAFDLGDNVFDPRQVGLCRFEAIPRRAAPGLVFGDAGGFFEDAAAVFGFLADNLIDHALLHHRISTLAETSVHKQVGDVEQATRDLIE